MADAILIRTESDLWEILRRAPQVTGIPSVAPVQIIGWRPSLLYFPTESIGHSLSPSLARAVTGFHNSLSRSFAYAAYGQADARNLRTADQEALDIRLLTVAGSNGFEVVEGALDRLTHALLNKLSGQQMMIIVAMFLLLHFGEAAMKDWLHTEYVEKAHKQDLDNSLKLSEQETERMQIMASVLDANPPWKPIKAIADEGRAPLLRGTLSYDRAKVLGVEITREQAKTIVAKEKAKGQSKRLDGRFEVVEIDIENPEGFMGTLRDIKTQQVVKVAINRGELPDEDLHTLFMALEQKSTVDAMVNAWVVGDKIAYASIVRANKAP